MVNQITKLVEENNLRTKMRNTFFFALLFGFALALTGCFNTEKKAPEPEPEPESDDIEITIGEDIGKQIDKGISEGMAGLKEALSELEDQLDNLDTGEKVEVVDFRDLKDELPQRINSMKRTNAEGNADFVADCVVTSELHLCRVQVRRIDMPTLRRLDIERIKI